LLTNDDGFYSPGIEALYKQCENLGHVHIVAPDQEQSATSMALNLHRPLRLKTIKENIYAVDGTPADCVYFAVQKILPRKPDILISGMNNGPNLGQQDVMYSGTVAGALQGIFLSIPSIAVSLIPDQNGRFFYDYGAKITHRIAHAVLKNSFFSKTMLNINIPPPPFRGIRIVKLGEKRYNPEIIEKEDPRMRRYFWIGTGTPKGIGDPDSDVKVIKKGYTTITPIHTNLTDFKILKNSSFQEMFSAIDHEIS